MNPHRNEVQVQLAGESILLRPTFENLAALEADVGGIPWLAWKYGRGVNIDKKGKVTLDENALPPLSITTKIIFHSQVPAEGAPRKGLEEVHELVMAEGMTASRFALDFIMKCTAGNKMAAAPTPAQKKR